jgi:3-deoxy-7-phosphoheptulonate synthase
MVERMVDRGGRAAIGARNMQNYALLSAAGETGKPCMLKRGLAATVTEWLQAADYLLAAGDGQVILCEARHPYV